MVGVLVGYAVGVMSELGQAPADVPHGRATREPAPAWSERAKTVPVPVLLRVEAPDVPVIEPREAPQPLPPAAPAATPAERRVMQAHDGCYPGYKQEFKYRGVWHWRCKYN
jgi:hypothetical protein